MEKRRLGTTDLELTTVGLGTWAIGGPWDWGWGPQNDADSLRTIREAIDLGINWIDTAPCYGLGHSERIVGDAVRASGQEVLIATKCGLVRDDPASGSTYERLTAASVRQEVEDSLRRLGVSRIDLYQIHWPEPEDQIEEAWAEMVRLREEGKVRWIGVSNFSVSQMERAAAIHPVASLQPPYSMLDRRFERAERSWCRTRGVGVVAYSPMQAGLLTGAFDRKRMESLPEGDWRLQNRHFTEPRFSRNLEIVDALRPIASSVGCSLAELAVAWTLRDPVVTAAIVGARRPGQISETVGASGLVLEPEVVARIEAVLAG